MALRSDAADRNPTAWRRIGSWMALGWPGVAAAEPIALGLVDLIPWVLGYLGLLVAVFVGAVIGKRKFAGSVVLAALILTPLAFFAAISSFESGRSRTSSAPAPPVLLPAPLTTEQKRAFQAYCGGPPALHAVAADTPRTLLVRVDGKAMYEATGLTSYALVDALFANPDLCRSSGLVAVEGEMSVSHGGATRWQRMDTSKCTRSAWREVPEADARYELVVGDRVEHKDLSGATATSISLRINDRVTGERVGEDAAFTLRGEPMPLLCRHGKEQLVRIVSGVFPGHK